MRLAASHVALMAGQLEVEHRWCVTGTPMGPGGLDDIRGMLSVLQHDWLLDNGVWDHVTGMVHGKGGLLDGEQSCRALVKCELEERMLMLQCPDDLPHEEAPHLNPIALPLML